MPRSARDGFTGHEVATTHGGTREAGSCRYHYTDVVWWKQTEITLNTGGFWTYTTKHRMNQTAAAYELGFSVHQARGDWYVTTAAGVFRLLGDKAVINRSTGDVTGAEKVEAP